MLRSLTLIGILGLALAAGPAGSQEPLGTAVTYQAFLREGGSPASGAFDFEFRLYDAQSGELLAVIRDRRTIGSLQWTRAAGVDIVNLFNSWAALLHTRVSGR
mgnify:CR=1 FL=1